jgi:hypothetical protein
MFSSDFSEVYTSECLYHGESFIENFFKIFMILTIGKTPNNSIVHHRVSFEINICNDIVVD